MSDAWLRAPSAIAGTLSVFFMYRWLVSIGGREKALAGALFLALNPFSLYYSQELRFYSLLVLFVIVSMIVFERFLAHPSPGNGAMLGCALALTCLSHFSGGFLCLAFLLYLLITGRFTGRYLGPALLAAVIVLGAISPWIYREIYFLRRIEVVNISTLPVEERLRGELTLNIWSYPYILYAFSTGYSFGPDLRELHIVGSAIELMGPYWPHLTITALLFGGLAVAGFVNSAKRGTLALFLSVVTVTIACGTIVALLNIKVFNVRYLMTAFPVFIALCAYGLPCHRIFRIALAAAVCAILLISDWNYHTVAQYARDDYKGAARIIDDREREGDLILATMADLFSYYYKGPNTVRFIIPLQEEQDGLRASVLQYIEGHPRIWYLRNRNWYFDPEDAIVDVLSSGFHESKSWDLPGIRLILYQNPAHKSLN